MLSIIHLYRKIFCHYIIIYGYIINYNISCRYLNNIMIRLFLCQLEPRLRLFYRPVFTLQYQNVVEYYFLLFDSAWCYLKMRLLCVLPVFWSDDRRRPAETRKIPWNADRIFEQMRIYAIPKPRYIHVLLSPRGKTYAVCKLTLDLFILITDQY